MKSGGSKAITKNPDTIVTRAAEQETVLTSNASLVSLSV